ncbi:MAG: hypothetical protein NWE76_04490 [Candidatus Bathyarchaeota archaeon]|nr:hypothetical protein [Candidatus Bathyarchaeota archaeon]
MAKNRRDWDSIIDKLNKNGKPMRIKMGSPGSAQVTRFRLMEIYDGLDAHTKGAYIHLDLA